MQYTITVTPRVGPVEIITVDGPLHEADRQYSNIALTRGHANELRRLALTVVQSDGHVYPQASIGYPPLCYACKGHSMTHEHTHQSEGY